MHWRPGSTDTVPPLGDAAPWPEADRLFRSDPRWRGGDDAYSIPLSPGRTLWLFGDSFIGSGASPSRRDCRMVHNTIAIQDGANPENASMRFIWHEDESGTPAPYFAGEGDAWFWPGDGVRIDDVLILFFMRVRMSRQLDDAPGDVMALWQRTDSLSFFTITGWGARLIRNPDADPMESVRKDDDSDVCIGSAGVFADDTHVYAAGFDLEQTQRRWRAPIWRWRRDAARAGDLTAPQRHAVLDGAPTEFTIHRFDDRLLQVQTTGVFSAGIAARTSTTTEGPWSPLAFLYSPPESDRGDALVYAGKAHPEQEGCDVALTYATVGITAEVTLDDDALYYPRFVKTTAASS